MHGLPVRPACSARPTLWCGGEGQSPRGRAMRGRRALARRRFAVAALPLHQCSVLTHEKVEVDPFLVGEFEKDLLALRVLEPFAIFFEETVRVPLAADANQQRLLIVDAAQET